jgi:hypothetical protein
MPNTYVALDTKSLSGISSITFNLAGISGYTDLVLVIQGVSSANQPANFRVGNGSVDTGSNYSRTGLSGNGSTATSYRGSSENFFYTDNASDANGGAVSITHFMNYSNTTTNKTFLNRNGATSNNVRAIVGLWRSTAAINIISADFGATLTGGTASLYGIANADQGAAKATGGIITEDSTYWYHTFGASGTFTPKQSLTCDYLILAGGGGGGNYNGGGGGGAGGYISGTGSFTATTYNITVGAGGASASAQGTNSTFNSLTAVGGGGGAGGGAGGAGTTGGSGGGGGGTTGSTSGLASSASGQGFAGGNAYYDGSNTRRGGGGGGATTVGVAATSSTNGAGNGGTGLTSSISGSSLVYAAGGGGGGHGADSAAGLGTTGVSGNGGSTAANPTNGTVNRGGGGGGGGGDRNVIGAGGSGIIIVRYLKA